MAKLLFFCTVLSSAVAASARTVSNFDGKSAHREPQSSYLEYMARSQVYANPVARLTHATAEDSAKPYGTVSLPAAINWASEAIMVQRFQLMRDLRWMTIPSQPGFLRRISWLYPDDGCFARASLAILNFFKWHQAVPNKVFVFGNLDVKTPNTSTGFVSWWYHVAPIVEVHGVKYVLDPAIYPKGPIMLGDWLKKMAADITTLQVAICSSGTYTPYEACDQATDGIEATANTDEQDFLGLEWARLVDLRRDPVQELGDHPPWL